MSLSLRLCTIEDIDMLCDFSRKTYFETFAHMNTLEDMEAYLNKAFDMNKIRAELMDVNSSFFFLYFDDKLAGYLKLNEAPAQTNINDEQKTGSETYFLSFEDSTRLEIMKRPNMVNSEKTLTRTGYIHLAFSVGSKEKVDTLTSQLEQAGYEIISGPRTTGDGYYESCVLGPEGNQIEISE